MNWQQSLTTDTEVLDRLRRFIASGTYMGTLRAGDRLPGIRALAHEFGVHPRALRQAYHLLQREGLIVIKSRSGVYLAERDAAPHTDRHGWLPGAAAEWIGRGVPLPRLMRVARHLLNASQLRAACLECNNDQIEWLEREAGEFYGFDAFGVDLDDAVAALPDLRRADLLIGTLFHQSQMEALARDAGKPLCLVVLSDEFVGDLLDAMAAGPLAVLVDDERLARKLPAMFSSAPGVRNLVAACADAMDRLPPNAAIYVTKRVVRLNGGRPPIPSIPHRPTVFAEVTTLELVRFIIRSNLTTLPRVEAE